MDELLAAISDIRSDWDLTAETMSDVRRIAALAFEAAARECEKVSPSIRTDNYSYELGRVCATDDCATAIRALSARLGE
jgi:hypothetical protein